MADSTFKLFKSLSAELDPIKLQQKFLNSLLKLQNVERGSIWIKEQDNYLCIEAAGLQSETVKGVNISMKHPSIVGWVIENGCMTIADTQKDHRHYKGLEKNLRVKSRLILCFPLFLRNREVYGAIQLIDTSPQKSRVNLDRSYLKRLQELIDIGSVALSNAILYKEQLKETESLRLTLEAIRSEGELIGQSSNFQKCLELADGYARTDFPVLITGESGTGKELFARRIHQLSSRRIEPFLTQNCSAIPESLLESELFGYMQGAFSGALKDKVGLFEAANGGTVFLDEIGDMPINLQANILRVIQNSEVKPLGGTATKHVDNRILSATNKDINTMLTQKTFRQDLYFRLSVLPLRLPPLRERQADIPLLANHFLRKESLKLEIAPKIISAEAMRHLVRYPWPGNVRELENLIRYLLVVVSENEIEPHHIAIRRNTDGRLNQKTAWMLDPAAAGLLQSRGATPPAPVIDFKSLSWHQVERSYVLYLLKKNQWNVSAAARDAALNRSTFVSRMKRLQIARTAGHAE
jgi:transcriptional regulator with GAF, ATPase, and Fis domain